MHASINEKTRRREGESNRAYASRILTDELSRELILFLRTFPALRNLAVHLGHGPSAGAGSSSAQIPDEQVKILVFVSDANGLSADPLKITQQKFGIKLKLAYAQMTGCRNDTDFGTAQNLILPTRPYSH